MYASDLTHKKRAEAIFRNLQLQKEWFATGKTIRILGQKGGNDYAYMTQVEEGCIADKCWKLYVQIYKTFENGPVSDTSAYMNKIDFSDSTIYDSGYGSSAGAAPYLDDALIKIPMGGMDFFFNGINYGNQVKWCSNNAIIFGNLTVVNTQTVNLDGNAFKGILLGNYDRLCSNLYYSNYNVNDFSITKLIVTFSNYYTPITNLLAGKLQIRLIKENRGNKRQWVEVGIISAPTSPGYSSVSVPSTDSTLRPIDPTKNSPWDISNGSSFLQIAGSSYSTAFPVAGTTILYESDKDGIIWTFTPNAHLHV